MTSMDASARAPSLLLRVGAALARWSLRLLLGAWLVVLLVWGAIHLVIVPRIGELRPHLERFASQAVGVPVRIGSVSAYSTGLVPAFELIDVVLSDPKGRDALRLPRILLAVSPQSLLALQFDQLYVDTPTLDVRRTSDGRVFVAGLEVTGSGPTDESMLDHVFAQPEFVIRHGAIQWTDEQRGVPTIALREVDLVMRNRGRRHDLRLDATPPPAWGERFALAARFEQPFLSMRNGRWREWAGQAYASFSHVEVGELKRYVDIGADLQQGRGALRAWVDIRRAQVSAVTADLALADVAVRVDSSLPLLEMAHLRGRLAGSFSQGQMALSTEQLAFETRQGVVWPGGNVRLNLVDADAGHPARGEFDADRLDLSALAQIGGRLPLGQQVLEALARYEPRGLVERISARWTGTLDKPSGYQVRGKVQQLAVRALPSVVPPTPTHPMTPGSPGIAGATIDFELSESGGKAALAVQDGSLSFPGVFEEPVIPLARLQAQLAWQRNGEALQLQGAGLRFANADTEGEAEFRWQTSDPARSSGRARYPGVLDLSGSLSRGNATRVHRYLPLVIPVSARHYVRDAVLAGSVANVRFKVKGDLHDMPFESARVGEFSITGSVKDAVYAYLPKAYQEPDALPWPVLSQVSGEVAFERKSMRIGSVRATLGSAGSLQLQRAEAVIADLTAAAPQVALGFDLRGPSADLLSTAQASPVGTLIGPALARASATGPADMRLRINLPLTAPDRLNLQGSLNLSGNDVLVAPDVPRLSRVRGTVNFTESGFTLVGVQARALGGDVRLDGGTVQAGNASPVAARLLPTLLLRAQGVATAEGLRQARELGIVARLAQWTSGSTSYAAQFALRAGMPEIALSSNLVGLGLQLPAPFAKAPDVALPLRAETALLPESVQPGPGGRVRLQDQLSLELGRVASIQYVRDLSGPEPRALRGAIGIGLAADEASVMPAEGVSANISMASADVDLWGDLLGRLSGTSLSGMDATQPAAGAADLVARSFLPHTLALRARELSVGGRRLHGIVAGGSRDGQVWRANVEAQELNGYVEYRQSLGNAPGRVHARLSRLTLAASSAGDVEKLLDDQPASIPALDVVVDELELRGKRLGRVEIEAVNRAASAASGGVREWRLNRLDVTTPEASLRATGNWAALNAQGAARPAAGATEPRRTVMNFKLDIQNSGELLARFGMKDVVRRGKGAMEGQVSWAGSPLTLDYASLGGNFNINIESGQFLKADPGLAKLLGVLSLQSLPRRLALDFRDVFTEGFLFDFVRGDVRIERGIATSNNLQMKGVNAAVLMEGQADLSRETQDLQVVVVPEINAGTASLIATAINPAIGLGSFLAQWVLRRPLMDAATQEFHIEGSWQDPKVTRVPRRAPTAPPPASRTEPKVGE